MTKKLPAKDSLKSRVPRPAVKIASIDELISEIARPVVRTFSIPAAHKDMLQWRQPVRAILPQGNQRRIRIAKIVARKKWAFALVLRLTAQQKPGKGR